MNTPPRLATRAAQIIFAAPLLLAVASAQALAQTTLNARTQMFGGRAQSSIALTQATPQPTATPEKTKPNSATATAQEPAQTKTVQLTTPREARARAYAKLLEGQRFLSRAKGSGSVTRDTLTAMQESFRQAAALDPTLAEAHTALAEVAFYFLDDANEAEQEARLAVRVDPDNYGAHRLLSRIYSMRTGVDESKLKREDADRAIAELKEVLRLDPSDAEALALSGEFYHLTGRENEAIDAFRRWVGAPATAETQFYSVITQGGELTTEAALSHLAGALLRAGRTQEAITTIRQALAADPGNHEYLELLSEAASKSGDPNAVIDELKRLADANPADAEAANALAQAQARAGKTDAAAATLRAAIARADKDDKTREALTVALAGVLADALRYDEAVAAYNDLLKSRGVADAPLVADSDKQFASKYLEEIIRLQRQAGRDQDALATVARMRRLFGANDLMAEFYSIDLLREQGKRDEALAAARAAREKYPENPSLLRLEATILAETGRVDEAATLLRSRLNGNFENDYQTNAQIVEMYIEANRGREAVDAAQKLLQMTPQQSPAMMTQSLVLLSSAQERAGDFKGAEESLRKVLARDPDSAIALNNLGYFLTEHGERLKEALDMIQRAVKSEPTNASYLDSLGWVYFKLGQLDEAERYLTDASRRNP
ncbi:MAG: tetratricopeptide repeat protein, partial [Acidobacteriota bacterium]|nr:tetratricopeptide repeat protein [Acidobacteriota bacterium]